MKFSILLSTVLSCCALESLASPLKRSARLSSNEKRQSKGLRPGDAICVGAGGKVPDPPGAAPRRQELAFKGTVKDTKRIKMRYGPYLVPNMMTKSVMGEGGALWNCGDAQIEKPCDECTLIGMVAGLEYPDGKNANIDTGLWLHHMVSLTVGPTRWDPTCASDPVSLPHFAVGTNTSFSERSFSSGNERTPISLSTQSTFLNGPKSGYHIYKEDSFRFIVDLMNMNMEDKTVYLTLTYDLIEGPLPSGWMDLKPVWFDIDQCGQSEVHAPKNNGAFEITARPWIPNFDGEVIGLGGHLHDGGVSIQLTVNNSTEVCTSAAKYGETSEYVFEHAGMTMPGGEIIAEKHISSMSTCYYDHVGVRSLDKAQSWLLKANYDFDRFTGNREADGDQANLMGIAIMYVAVPPGGVKRP